MTTHIVKKYRNFGDKIRIAGIGGVLYSMKMRYTIAAAVVFSITMGSLTAAPIDAAAARYGLDKNGGFIEVLAPAGDEQTRDTVRHELQQESRNGFSFATPAMLEHKTEIQYRYEKTAAGGRIRIIAKNREAILAVQDFLRSRMTKPAKNGDVVFDYVGNTPLIVVPVLINNHGPYRFLLDTGANRTILSTAIADSLGIPRGPIESLFSAAGDFPVNVRKLSALQLGNTRAENVNIAVGDFPLMKKMNVEGVLGADFLRSFKVSIDYNNMLVCLEPSVPQSISMLT